MIGKGWRGQGGGGVKPATVSVNWELFVSWRVPLLRSEAPIFFFLREKIQNLTKSFQNIYRTFQNIHLSHVSKRKPYADRRGARWTFFPCLRTFPQFIFIDAFPNGLTIKKNFFCVLHYRKCIAWPRHLSYRKFWGIEDQLHTSLGCPNPLRTSAAQP